MVGLNLNLPALLSDQRSTAMVAVMVADEDTVNLGRVNIESSKARLQLRSAESLVDEDFRLFGFEQCGVPTTASSEVREYHCHSNREHLVASSL